ncbi:MAG: hypothetical protein J5626_06305 [Lachnospiraceae bacterium]|nr:hypothetical protein [Lachnospiraceae bacterium]
MKNKICCALICSAICLSLAACGKETASSTFLKEEPLVTSSAKPSASVSSEPSTEAPESEESVGFSEDEMYAGISYVNALAAVRVEAGSGSIVNSVEKGAMPDGTEAWEVNVSPITESGDEITVVYYVHDDFCSVLQ